MFAKVLARTLERRGISYGWVVVLVTFLTMLATAGAMGSAGVLIRPLQAEFGWSESQISAALAVRLALFGLLGPFAAAFMNQFGIRRVVTFALVMISGGILASFAMTQYWHMVVLWGIVLGIGTGMTALVLGATVATRWFSERRGVVVALLTVSNATGQLLFLPLLAGLTDLYGWRSALVLTVSALILALILVLLLMRDYPSDIGQLPYGATSPVAEARTTEKLGKLLFVPITILGEVARDRTFWILFLTFFVCGLSTNGLIQTHWISICGDFGFAAVGAASMLAVIGLFDFIGTLGAGWLSDRFDNRWLLFWFYGLRGLSLIFLSVSGFGIYELSLFAIFYGLDWVATVPPTVKLAAARFGTRANIVFGWVFAGHQLGAAVAAFGAGWIRTDFATFMPALYIAGSFCLLASVAVLAIRRPSQTGLRIQPA